MTRKTANLSIVFADISGSTRLYENLGDDIARGLIADCLELMTQCVVKQRGRVVKTIGDEVMCIFAAAENAVRASVAMQEVVTDELPRRNSDTPSTMTIRIGLHFGQVIAERGDVFGDAVNVAARMANVAKGGQIIATRSLVKRVPRELQQSTRHLDRIPIRGKGSELDIYEVIWQPEDVTRIVAPVMVGDLDATRASLLLRYRDTEIDISNASDAVILGRGQKADLVVDDSMASREHARVECRR
ncbi:MAG: adenylate/guanylate cyclase domain-containing protein, partial [Pseudomonadota bacterium]